ncbi:MULTISPECIES: sugar ABC transporter permease [Fervidobacterium]|uniref:Xylose transport system permease protein XylH n=1 Tax=Fervidobacterium nodosum (strain ATCC 35602 / DSM 5306 / Rt17-B1) TaxID=381764 RepID=A7HNM0_FERNB|nr:MULTISPECIES: sugar ABC transporter permease [Fervidobacterium]ABS61503.1 Monosaccharide-transporting ATPase [Fervidobacterium nodosum Rt17-B1]KAF2961945.1 ABC transporter permease [Fervidobacterium sp. 2310opik-2]PHJ12970.1 ABC transporter permease [Fervidobacterium sp. SC_NGM5_G05]
MGFFGELKVLLKKNIREYGMYIALGFIMAIFTILTNGLFFSSRNISNLFNQMGYIAVLAVGMTLVIVIRHIDLSVGFMAGFLGAIAARLLRDGLPVIPTILIVIGLGTIFGLMNGFLVANVGLPAFVATLAGMMIFRGALLLFTQSTGTIIVMNDNFNQIGNGYIPELFKIGELHGLTIVVGLAIVTLYILNEIKVRNNKLKYNFEVLSMRMFILKILFVSAIIFYVFWVLANYNGLSWTFVITLLITFVYHIMTTKTVLGRHIYAVGGNPEAAKLSGIDVKKITLFVFGSMGFLTAISGILYTSRLQSATPDAGTLFELDAIAAAYVGGVSAAGGVGKVANSLIGALVMASLINGMNLLGVGISLQYIIRGLVLVFAVVFDIKTRSKVS